LDLAAVFVGRGDLAVGEQGAQVLRHDGLAGVRTGEVEALVERRRRPFEGLEAHRAGDVGGRGEPLGVEERERAEGGHVLGAIDEREALLRLELDRRNPT
jgi:hypothetical protein